MNPHNCFSVALASFKESSITFLASKLTVSLFLSVTKALADKSSTVFTALSTLLVK